MRLTPRQSQTISSRQQALYNHITEFTLKRYVISSVVMSHPKNDFMISNSFPAGLWTRGLHNLATSDVNYVFIKKMELLMTTKTHLNIELREILAIFLV